MGEDGSSGRPGLALGPLAAWEPALPVGLLPPGAVLERVATGCTWVEGPCWVPEEAVLVWSDIPADRILQWDPASGRSRVRRSGVEHANGRTPAPGGGWYQCSHGRRAVELERAGAVGTVVDRWRGHRLNSPNDVVVAADGALWFTDPDYGITVAREGHPGEREYGGCWVFRLGPDGDLAPVVTDCQQPNGLAFSPDGSVLYVADTGATSADPAELHHHVRAFDVGRDPRELSGGQVLLEAASGVVDGLRVDAAGRLWCSGAGGVAVHAPDGAVLGLLPVPEVVSNLCFGGTQGDARGGARGDDRGDDLVVTATTSVYRVPTLVRGA